MSCAKDQNCNLSSYKVKTFISFCLLLFSSFLYANERPELEKIKQAAIDHVQHNIDMPAHGELKITVSNIDHRLHATTCESGLTTSNIGKLKSTGVTVLVRCEQENWQIYVPVRTSLTLPLVSATMPLARGHLITRQDVHIQQVEQRAFRRQGYTRISDVVGARVKRSIRSGQVVERNDICAVCRSESVVITATNGSLTITTKGTAISDGTIGEQVKVKNDKSKRIISATVIGIGEVSVRF